MSESYILQAKDLKHVFKSQQKHIEDTCALQNINMQIRAGELTALVGPDGAGKTTFLRLIAGLYQPTTGVLEVLGLNVAEHAQAIQNRISYMPQRFGLYEDLSIIENLNLYADLHGVSKHDRQQRFDRLLKITDLTAFTQRLAGQLSGGMKQKLGLACTLVRSPELLLLDEPSVGVDPLSRRDLWTIIERLVQEDNLNVIISTAYMDEAERCDQVYVMYNGQVIQQGTPLQLRTYAKDRTWQVLPPKHMKARVLQAALLENTKLYCDAVPKGEMVRFITQDAYSEFPKQLFPEELKPEARTAELEDAFMLILHRTQQTSSTETLIENELEKVDELDILKSIQSNNGDERVITVQNLTRKFGDFTAVASTSFEVYRGEIFGLLGPNGAGKTTTFRMLCGLLPASSGTLEVAGVNLRTARAQARAKIGYVSQKFALYGNLSVHENLKFFGGAYGLSGKKLKQQIEKMLTQFHLKPEAISGNLPAGFKQRLSMAAALLHEPEILFLDEPTSGIDPLARRTFWHTIGELANRGITIIVTTHFMEEAEYCDRIAIQDTGKLLALGSPQEVRLQAGMYAGKDMNSAFIAIVEQARHVNTISKESV
ncbi:ATP-binding cassette domain-containing protein [Acinetobacter sp. PK01]|uniref:ATP-binding cassette domain-containing protein n=1 Tax=Acinetobacter sp. PK01 TaxID=2930198 RepID=UPI001FB7B740|nr:ATP-binding cassette domain-containing protein [Acinetobacter sp. PK01]UOG19146.1 ATP-binding cassette domain-containing protein [Acinetobacter sp. PK01]